MKKMFPAIKRLPNLEHFFSNILTSLDIPKYDQCDPIAGNIDDPIIKSIVKYRNYSSILIKV